MGKVEIESVPSTLEVGQAMIKYRIRWDEKGENVGTAWHSSDPSTQPHLVSPLFESRA